MKIAVIGAGIAGLSAAYLASESHEVTIFEKDIRLGGHANTVTIKQDGTSVAVDTGFMVYNPSQYPNFIALTSELGITSVDTTMTFGVYIPGELEFRGNFPNGVFANRKNVFNSRYVSFLREIIRFRNIAKSELVNNPTSNETLQEFLQKHSCSDDLANWFLYPMLSAVWSIHDVERVGAFPAISSFIFLNNHKLLDQHHPTWKTIKGGSIEYVKRIQKTLEKRAVTINLGVDISKVERSSASAKITVGDIVHEFDYVVFATHANTAQTLISDISPEEKTALEKFVYSKNTTVLHSDSSVMPPNKRIHAAWNYKATTDSSGKVKGIFTYNMNKLQHIPKEIPVYVTLNPDTEIDESKIHQTISYEHPQYSNQSLEGQRLIKQLQSKNRTLFAGAHLGYGFHEDGIVSAMQALETIGISAPWQKPN